MGKATSKLTHRLCLCPCLDLSGISCLSSITFGFHWIDTSGAPFEDTHLPRDQRTTSIMLLPSSVLRWVLMLDVTTFKSIITFIVEPSRFCRMLQFASGLTQSDHCFMLLHIICPLVQDGLSISTRLSAGSPSSQQTVQCSLR